VKHIIFEKSTIPLMFIFLSGAITPPFGVLWVSDFHGGDYLTTVNGLMFFVTRSEGGTWISRSGTTFFYALNVSTGAHVWNYSVDEWLTIAFDNQRVYFGGNNGHLVAANQDDGSIYWRLNLTGAILTSPVVENSTVYVGVRDVIYAISTLGEILWQKLIPSQPREDAKIAEGYSLPPEPGVHTEIISLLSQGHHLYGVITHEKTVVSGSDGNRPWARYASSDIFCVDPNSKEVKWLIPSPNYDKGLVGVSDEFVYFGTDPIYALDSYTGEITWNYTISLFHFYGSIKIQQIADELILIILPGKTICLNLTTCEIVWDSSGGFVSHDNKLYSSSSKQVIINNEVFSRIELSAIDCISGNLSWKHTFLDLDEGYGSPIVYDDKLFLLCSDKIYAFKSVIPPTLTFLGLDWWIWTITISVIAAIIGTFLVIYKRKRPTGPSRTQK
jgi:outer membrane protein assembly factor BamB